MDLLGLHSLSLWLNLLVFAGAAAAVWVAGSRLAGYVERISDITGLGAGFLGLLLLGGITSLPEVATVSTASLAGNAPLAVNNVLGTSGINVLLLAVGDTFIGERALTSVIGAPTPMLQGVIGIVLMTYIVMAMTVGEASFLGMGVWSASLLPLFLFAIWLNSRYQHHKPWHPDGQMRRMREQLEQAREGSGELDRDRDRAGSEHQGPRQEDGGGESDESDGNEREKLKPYVVKTAVAAAVILGAGFVLAQSGDAIAAKSGIGASLVGAVLLGFATSLPEISSIRAALQLKQFNMALGDIFGTNIFNLVLIFVADLLYSGPPVLSQAGAFEVVATLLAILLTAIYLVGLLERQDRTVWRLGYPSFAVILVYAAGLFALYTVNADPSQADAAGGGRPASQTEATSGTSN